MIRCPTCSYENLETSTYCERCGSVLNPTVAPTVPAYAAPSGPPPPPAESLQATQYAAVAPSKPRRHKRTVGGAILSSLLYLWAVFWASYGIGSGIQYGLSSRFGSVIFFGCLLLGLLLLVYLLRTQTHPTLGVWARIGLEFGLFVLGIAGIVAVYNIFPSSTMYAEQLAANSGVCLVYGLIAAIFSFW